MRKRESYHMYDCPVSSYYSWGYSVNYFGLVLADEKWTNKQTIKQKQKEKKKQYLIHLKIKLLSCP